MPGLIDLVRVNAAKETTWGTKVTPATVSFMGVKDFKVMPIVESEVIKDVRGSLVPGVLAVVKKIGMTASLSRFATYEDAPYTLDALCGLATATPGATLAISGATNATPIVITCATHGLADGDPVVISGVGGNTAANASCYAKVTGYSATTFGMYSDKALTTAIAGNGAYTSGGTVTKQPYTYAYVAPITGQIVPRIQTLYQYSNDANSLQAYYAAIGCVLSKFALKADSLTPVEFAEDYIGKQVSAAIVGDVGSPVDRTVTPIMGNDHALWIDAWGGTIGTTAITPDAYSLSIQIDPPREVVYYLGSALPGTWKDGRWKGSMKLTLEFGTATKAYYDAILAATSNFQKQIRNKFTNGTSSLQFDFAGTNVKAPQLFTNKNGVLTIELELEGTYNSTLANWFKAVAVNSVAAMA